MKEDIRARLFTNNSIRNFYQECCIEFIDRLQIFVITKRDNENLEIEIFFNVYTDKQYSIHNIDNFTSFALNYTEYKVILSNLEDTEFLLKKIKRNREELLKMFKNSTLLL